MKCSETLVFKCNPEVSNVICYTPYDIHFPDFHSQFNGIYRHFISFIDNWKVYQANNIERTI